METSASFEAGSAPDLKVIVSAATEVLGPDVHRLATLHTNAKTDAELLRVWFKSHADGSPHTVRVYRRVGARSWPLALHQDQG
jgi:hypothetical protein